MSLFRKLFSGGGKKKKKDYPNVIQDVDPLESWKKIGELGDGAFGKVYKTEHRESGTLAAMKRVPIRDELELDDFMVEIDILADCKHENIVGLHEAYFYDQALWIYIEFCAGGAVDDIIVELDHGLSEPQIRCISRYMFEALEFLHSSNCIHRDLKAGNILLCSNGSIKLADFGVSAKDSKGKQKHDTFIGTPYWMAPEVVVCETIKDDPYDSKADIWSAGITMIELADMNPPYHEMSPMRVLQKIVKKDPPTLISPSRWSKDFSDIIAKCLMKFPSGRYSACQLLEHSFIVDVTDNKPLRILYQEMKSEVEEIVEELAEDADLTSHSQDTSPVDSTPPPPPPPHTSQSNSSLAMNSEPSDPAITALSEENPPSSSSGSVPESVQGSDRKSDENRPVTIKQGDNTSLGSNVSGPNEETQEGGAGGGGGGSQRDNYKYATLSRVRKFKVDGEVMQSTTRKIVDVTANRTLRDNKKYQQMRKQDFRELKQLARDEMKEATEFYSKIKVDREVQDKKFETETVEIERRYESDLEVISKRQKKEIDRQENQHIQQFKSKLKYIKAQQSKDMKRFKDNLKEEEKLALKKVEVSVPKSERKVAMNAAKMELQAKRMQKDSAFCGKQAEDMETEVKAILMEQKEERKTLELSFLDVRQDLRRSHTSLLWEMEQRQKQDHHQLVKQQLREAFHMQRHQMHARHQMEVELQGRRDQFQLEELRQQQLLEKRQNPKKLKADHKQKITEARKALRNKKGDKDTLRKLDEQYIQLCQLETELMNERHEKSMDTLKAELDANMRELHEIQNEKKMMLTQQETKKVKERDDQHTLELREWRGEILKRKQKLEEEFRASRNEQEQFYSLDRPLPKQLRSSLFLASARSEPDSRIHSTSTTSLPPFVEPGKSRPAMDPLDEVVLGTPILSRSSPTPQENTLHNGNST